MNKDILGRLVAKNHALSYVDETIFLKAMIKDFMALIDELEQKVEILEEKATPKKAEQTNREPYHTFCSVCGGLVFDNFNYCPKCGQALDWSEEDE